MVTTSSSSATPRQRLNALGVGEGGSFHLPRRSAARLLGATAIMAIGCWIAAAAFLSVGSRREVLVVARTLPRYHVIGRSDLRIARVAADEQVATVPADHLNDLLGRRTESALAKGSLLNEAALLAPDTQPVRPDEAVVGTLLTLADAPRDLPQGASVRVILRPPTGSDGSTRSLSGRILDVTDAGPSSGGARRASIVIGRSDAESVSAAASDNRVALVVLGER